MKIIIATPLYPPEIGGPATHAKFIVDEFLRRGYEITVIPFSRVRRYPNVLRHVIYFWHIVRNSKNVDTIYALDPVSVGLPALLAAAVVHRRFILRVAGDYAWEQGVQRFGIQENLEEFLASRKHPLPVRMFQKIQRLVARHAAAVVVPSEYFKTVVARWGIADKKIQVVYSALEKVSFPAKEEARKELGIQGVLIVSAGRLVKWKGFIGLIDVFVNVQKKFPNVTLRIIGEGPQRTALQDHIQKKALGARVFLEGSVPQKKLWQWIAAADVFALNTSYEGLSHQLIEAMHGTPIVTTAVGGNGELIENGKSGLLLQPNDIQGLTTAIESIVADRAMGERLVAGAKHSLQRFAPEKSLQLLAALFQQNV